MEPRLAAVRAGVEGVCSDESGSARMLSNLSVSSGDGSIFSLRKTSLTSISMVKGLHSSGGHDVVSMSNKSGNGGGAGVGVEVLVGVGGGRRIWTDGGRPFGKQGL